MAETKYKPVRHDHKAFLRKAKRRSGFQEAYRALADEYEVASEVLAPRDEITREAVAPINGTSKSAVSRPEKIDPLE